MPTQKELEAAYSQAAFGGGGAPSLGLIRCGVCRRNFTLPRDAADICVHIREQFTHAQEQDAPPRP